MKPMEELDYFYRAYEGYKKEFALSREDALVKKTVRGEKNADDAITMIKTTCTIEEDWIVEIEKGLVYIGKAIREDRQFIRNEGEVLPIEKIRKVSKDSVVDLAKHSDYITKLPENPEDNLVPEKLLMIRREDDYTVYENRVVYATLVYLKEFVASRLARILDAMNRYEGKCFLKKKIDLGYRIIDFTLSLNETRKDDPIARKESQCQAQIERISELLNDIVLLLRTHLMSEVSKAPLVNRPITKTNVLRMDTNFKESLAIFDYACAYDKDGFTITKTEERISPLPAKEMDEATDLVSLTSFLAYEANNHLEPELHERFLLEEKRRKDVSDEELLSRLHALKDKIAKSGKEMDEYLLLLEEGTALLEKKLAEAKDVLQAKIDEYEKKIKDLNEAHAKAIEELKRQHQEVIDAMIASHEKEIAELDEAHKAEMDKLAESKEAEKAALKAESDKTIEGLKVTIEADEKSIAELNGSIDSFKKEAADAKMEASQKIQLAEEESARAVAEGKAASEKASAEAKDAYEKATSEAEKKAEEKVAEALEEKELAQAELKAMRVSAGKDEKPADYTSRERFEELEKEKKILDKFFDLSWKATKKAIRKELLGNPSKDK
jgi:hypothetical protein